MKKPAFALVLSIFTANIFANCMTGSLTNGCNADQWEAYNQQQNMIRSQQQNSYMLQQQQEQINQLQQQRRPVTCYPNGMGGFVCQ